MSALSMAAYAIASSPLHTKLSNLTFTHTSLPLPAHRFFSKSIIKPLKPFGLNTQNPNSLSHFHGTFAASFDNFEGDPDENITAQDDPINEIEDFEQEVEQEEEEEDDDEDEESDVRARELNEEGKLYVGNLPYSTTSSELAEVFEEAGQVMSAVVIYDRVTDRSRGFGFVTMGSVEEAKEAIRMFNGSQVGGRTVRVNFPEVPKGGEREIMGPRMRSGYKGFIDSPHKLYAGNLGWRLTSEGLRDAFADQPGLLSAKVVYERDSGRSRGFGFVSFETAADAEAAIEAMNGVEVEGRPLRLDSAAAGERARPPPVQENSTENDPESIELLSRTGS